MIKRVIPLPALLTPLNHLPSHPDEQLLPSLLLLEVALVNLFDAAPVTVHQTTPTLTSHRTFLLTNTLNIKSLFLILLPRIQILTFFSCSLIRINILQGHLVLPRITSYCRVTSPAGSRTSSISHRPGSRSEDSESGLLRSRSTSPLSFSPSRSSSVSSAADTYR